jgi:hypothetical protein
MFIYLLLTAIGLIPGGSVYKDKVHEHPQYNTLHIHKYNTSTKSRPAWLLYLESLTCPDRR